MEGRRPMQWVGVGVLVVAAAWIAGGDWGEVLQVVRGELSIMTGESDCYFIVCSAKSPGDAGYISFCHGIVTCPLSCPKCELSCQACGMVSCPTCDKNGSICDDPKFVGGDGVMFYFHGHKDQDFCIVSDHSLHVNAHFIGKSAPGRPRDFTWVKSLAFTWAAAGHRLYVGAASAATWNPRLDHLVVNFDGHLVQLPRFQSDGRTLTWSSPRGGAVLTRTAATNAVRLEIEGLLAATLAVVPVTREDSRVHGYEVGPDDCFAHLEIAFDYLNLSAQASGVLGQTYTPGFVNPVKRGVPMPVMGGHHLYSTSSLFAPDCKVSRYPSTVTPSTTNIALHSTSTLSNFRCGSNGVAGSGLVCRK